jgi:HAD superfamily hydrolase (TIGR01490 family)
MLPRSERTQERANRQWKGACSRLFALSWLYRVMRRPAAFFDLDRTLIATSSSLALARPFHDRGLVGRRDVLKARLAQAVLAHVGAPRGREGQATDSAVAILVNHPAELLQEIVSDAWPTVLKPLVYRDAVELAAAHKANGRPVFVVSAALQEIGDCVARELGFDGALGSRAETRDGVFTGRVERRLLGQSKADAVVDFATSERLDLPASVAYSDSHTDLPFLEAVGSAVAVNPDRRLGRIAADRGWPVRKFSARAFAAE